MIATNYSPHPSSYIITIWGYECGIDIYDLFLFKNFYQTACNQPSIFADLVSKVSTQQGLKVLEKSYIVSVYYIVKPVKYTCV
jgi:hypothetical protein